MEKRFYPPSFDFIFKLVFGDQRNIKILTAFLIAALDLPEEEFDHLVIIDPHLTSGGRLWRSWRWQASKIRRSGKRRR